MARRALPSLVSLVALALAACAPQGSTSASTQLQIGLTGLGSDVTDPILGDAGTISYMRLVYDPIIGSDPRDASLSAKYGLTQKWDIGANSLTLHLRQGIKFQNGDDLTADDVVFTIQRSWSPESVTGYGALMKDYVKDVTSTDPYTVTITSSKPASLLYLLSGDIGTDGLVVPKKYIQDKGIDNFRAHPIGSGPYRIKELRYDSDITLESAGKHWRIGVPKYKSIRIRLIPEISTASAMLQRGDLDAADVGTQVEALKKQGFHAFVKHASAVIHIYLDGWYLPGTPLSDIRVREALNLAIDRNAINKTLFDGLYTPVSLLTLATASDLKFDQTPYLYPYDPDRAKALLKEYGKPISLPLYTIGVEGVQNISVLAAAVAGYWEAVGVKVTITPSDKAAEKTMMARMWKTNTGTYNAAWFGSTSVRAFVPTIDLWRKLLYVGSSSGQFYGGDRPGQPLVYSPIIDAIVAAPDLETARARAIDLGMAYFKAKQGAPLFVTNFPMVTSKNIKSWDMGQLPKDLNIEDLVVTK
jgi:peptide/nickel transport system substrate-binding protein